MQWNQHDKQRTGRHSSRGGEKGRNPATQCLTRGEERTCRDASATKRHATTHRHAHAFALQVIPAVCVRPHVGRYAGFWGVPRSAHQRPDVLIVKRQAHALRFGSKPPVDRDFVVRLERGLVPTHHAHGHDEARLFPLTTAVGGGWNGQVSVRGNGVSASTRATTCHLARLAVQASQARPAVRVATRQLVGEPAQLL